MIDLADIVEPVGPVFSELQSFIDVDQLSIFVLVVAKTVCQLQDLFFLCCHQGLVSAVKTFHAKRLFF